MPDIENLIRALYQTVGNKRYMHSVEKMLREKLSDLSPEQKDSLRYLISDLKQLKVEADRKDKRW